MEKDLIDLNELRRLGQLGEYKNYQISNTGVWCNCIVLGRASRINGNTISGIVHEPIWEIINEYGEPQEIYRFKDANRQKDGQTDRVRDCICDRDRQT